MSPLSNRQRRGNKRWSRALPAVATAVAFAVPISSTRAAVTISSDQTQNMTCANDICQPTAQDAILNVTDLENLLVSGNIEVTTTGSGVQADDINASAALSWSNGNALSLDAYRSITVGGPITLEGQGGLSLTTNDGGKRGLLSFVNTGNVVFANLSSQLTIDGKGYLLVDSIASLASVVAADPEGDYALANSYDAGSDGTYSQSPIETAFRGRFEGLGNIISNLTITDSVDKHVGLFAKLRKGHLNDIGLANVNVAAVQKALSAGALVGDVEGGSIESAFVSGSIAGRKQEYTGGLVGYAFGGSISKCWSSVSVSGGNTTGGLVGFADAGEAITLSYATGAVSGGKLSATGGLVGQNLGVVKQSFALGGASNPQGSSGGLVGNNVGNVEETYSTGPSSGQWAGGLVGSNKASGTISQSYSTGEVSGSEYSGGLIGNDVAPGGSMKKTYWNTTTSGITNPGQGAGNIANDPGIKGKTTAQLQSGLPKGFSRSIWAEDPNINGGLPYLIANPPQQ